MTESEDKFGLSLADAETSTKNILDKVFQNLQTSGATAPGTPPRLFFPNGIDFINLTVNVTSLVDVSITISGVGKPPLNASLITEEIEQIDNPT